MFKMFFTKVFIVLYLIFMFGCSESLEERQRKLDRTTEPGTIDYMYESISIAIEKTEHALELTKEHEDEIVSCVGEDNYDRIVSDVENKIDHLKGERPWYLTTLFFGDKYPFSPPEQYRSPIKNVIDDMENCIRNETFKKQSDTTVSKDITLPKNNATPITNSTDSTESLDTNDSTGDIHPMVSSILKSTPGLKVIRTDKDGTTYFSDGTTFNPGDIE